MKSFVSAMALAGFLSVALFGFAGLSSMGEGKCVAETYAGTICYVMTTAEQVSFHVNAFSSFLSSAGANTFVTILGLLLLTVFVVLRLYMREALVLVPVFARSDGATLSPPYKKKLLRFLALFEHSPSRF